MPPIRGSATRALRLRLGLHARESELVWRPELSDGLPLTGQATLQ